MIADMSTEQELSLREKALIERGYDENLVRKLCFCCDEELDRIVARYASMFYNNTEASKSPVCILLGGQPGSGKSTYMHSLTEKYPEKFVLIGIDYYRTWHPNYILMEDEIKRHWIGLEENENQSPGNDIADFTHSFAGRMTDKLIAYYCLLGKNMIIEWGLRNPEEPLTEMRRLKEKGYRIEVIYIASDSATSMSGCNHRAELMKESGHVMRKVPQSFHDLAVSSMPLSSHKIWKDGFRNNICDSMAIYDRSDRIIWNSDMETDPYPFYEKALNEENESVPVISDYTAEAIRMELLGVTERDKIS